MVILVLLHCKIIISRPIIIIFLISTLVQFSIPLNTQDPFLIIYFFFMWLITDVNIVRGDLYETDALGLMMLRVVQTERLPVYKHWEF